MTNETLLAQGCSARVYHGTWGGSHCSRRASVIENGKPYCKQHAPSHVRARREQRNERLRRKLTWEAQMTQRIKAEEAEQRRRAACFDDLLAALEHNVDTIDDGLVGMDNDTMSTEDFIDEMASLRDQARAAIEKTRGG